MTLSLLTLSGQKEILHICSAYKKVDASTNIWVVEGNETIAYKLVAAMDTHLHMNCDPIKWSSMGKNEVVID